MGVWVVAYIINYELRVLVSKRARHLVGARRKLPGGVEGHLRPLPAVARKGYALLVDPPTEHDIEIPDLLQSLTERLDLIRENIISQDHAHEFLNLYLPQTVRCMLRRR